MHQKDSGHPDLIVPKESAMPKIRTKKSKGKDTLPHWKASMMVMEETNKKLNAEAERMLTTIEELRNKLVLEESLKKDFENMVETDRLKQDSLRKEMDYLRSRLDRAQAEADTLRVDANQKESTAIIFAMLHLGSEDRISMRDRIEIIDALRDTAGYSAEEVGTVPVEVLCKAFTIITPEFFRAFAENKKASASKRSKDIAITPEDIERVEEMLRRHMRNSPTSK